MRKVIWTIVVLAVLWCGWWLGASILAQQAIEKRKKHEGVPLPDKRGTPQVKSPGKTKRLGGKWQPVGESNPSFQVENLAS